MTGGGDVSTKRTPADRDRVLALHAEGKGRNEIHRETGYPLNYVSTVVKQAGLTFERGARVAAATAAATMDNKARRANIINRMYRQAEEVLDRLENPTEYTTLTKGTGGAEHATTLDFIPANDRKAELTSIGISLDKAIKLEQVDTDNGAKHAVSMLDRLAEQLEGVSLADIGLGDQDPPGGEPEATALPGDQ